MLTRTRSICAEWGLCLESTLSTTARPDTPPHTPPKASPPKPVSTPPPQPHPGATPRPGFSSPRPAGPSAPPPRHSTDGRTQQTFENLFRSFQQAEENIKKARSENSLRNFISFESFLEASRARESAVTVEFLSDSDDDCTDAPAAETMAVHAAFATVYHSDESLPERLHGKTPLLLEPMPTMRGDGGSRKASTVSSGIVEVVYRSEDEMEDQGVNGVPSVELTKESAGAGLDGDDATAVDDSPADEPVARHTAAASMEIRDALDSAASQAGTASCRAVPAPPGTGWPDMRGIDSGGVCDRDDAGYEADDQEELDTKSMCSEAAVTILESAAADPLAQEPTASGRVSRRMSLRSSSLMSGALDDGERLQEDEQPCVQDQQPHEADDEARKQEGLPVNENDGKVEKDKAPCAADEEARESDSCIDSISFSRHSPVPSSLFSASTYRTPQLIPALESPSSSTSATPLGLSPTRPLLHTVRRNLVHTFPAATTDAPGGTLGCPSFLQESRRSSRRSRRHRLSPPPIDELAPDLSADCSSSSRTESGPEDQPAAAPESTDATSTAGQSAATIPPTPPRDTPPLRQTSIASPEATARPLPTAAADSAASDRTPVATMYCAAPAPVPAATLTAALSHSTLPVSGRTSSQSPIPGALPGRAESSPSPRCRVRPGTDTLSDSPPPPTLPRCHSVSSSQSSHKTNSTVELRVPMWIFGDPSPVVSPLTTHETSPPLSNITDAMTIPPGPPPHSVYATTTDSPTSTPGRGDQVIQFSQPSLPKPEPEVPATQTPVRCTHTESAPAAPPLASAESSYLGVSTPALMCSPVQTREAHRSVSPTDTTVSTRLIHALNTPNTRYMPKPSCFLDTVSDGEAGSWDARRAVGVGPNSPDSLASLDTISMHGRERGLSDGEIELAPRRTAATGELRDAHAAARFVLSGFAREVCASRAGAHDMHAPARGRYDRRLTPDAHAMAAQLQAAAQQLGMHDARARGRPGAAPAPDGAPSLDATVTERSAAAPAQFHVAHRHAAAGPHLIRRNSIDSPRGLPSAAVLRRAQEIIHTGVLQPTTCAYPQELCILTLRGGMGGGGGPARLVSTGPTWDVQSESFPKACLRSSTAAATLCRLVLPSGSTDFHQCERHHQ